MKKVFLFFISLIGVFVFYQYSYTKFIPMVYKDEKYVTVRIDNNFNNNLKIVLDCHEEKYKVSEDGDIMIRRYLSNDEELIYNYTKKTMDENWFLSNNELIELYKRSN